METDSSAARSSFVETSFPVRSDLDVESSAELHSFVVGLVVGLGVYLGLKGPSDYLLGMAAFGGAMVLTSVLTRALRPKGKLIVAAHSIRYVPGGSSPVVDIPLDGLTFKPSHWVEWESSSQSGHCVIGFGPRLGLLRGTNVVFTLCVDGSTVRWAESIQVRYSDFDTAVNAPNLVVDQACLAGVIERVATTEQARDDLMLVPDKWRKPYYLISIYEEGLVLTYPDNWM